jgi:hypothetical protein
LVSVTAQRDPYINQPATSFDAESGVTVSGNHIGNFDNGDYVEYATANFGSDGAASIVISLAVPASNAGQQVQIRLDSPTGTLIGTLVPQSTGSWGTYQEQSTTVTNTTGVHSIYLVASGSSGICNIQYFRFVQKDTQVSLSSAYNKYGIYTDGTSYSTGGIDGAGYSYSATQLGTSVSYAGDTYTFGSSNALDTVAAAGQNITLPSGYFSALTMIGTGTNGNQTNEPFIVTYTDGTTATIYQTFSDWSKASGASGETTVKTMSYRNNSSGGKQTSNWNIYGYTLLLDSTKEVASIKLPSASNVNILAMGLVG